jgi:hypothetical protein
MKLKHNTYYELMQEIRQCKTDSQLLAIAMNIDANKKELGLDDYQVEKLESAGIQQFERMKRDREMLIKNRKK